MLTSAVTFLLRLGPFSQYGVLLALVLAIFSTGSVAGAKAQHLREAGARNALLVQIVELKARETAQERARADSAVEYAQSLERLSAASETRWVAITEMQRDRERSLDDFIREVQADDGNAPCRVTDADLARWMRHDADQD